MFGGRERERERKSVSNIFHLFFKGLQFTMPKRIRNTEFRRDRDYRKKRRYNSLSPSRGRHNKIDIDTQMRILQMNLDLLRAQVKLLRKEVRDLRQQPPTGQKHEKSTCAIM